VPYRIELDTAASDTIDRLIDLGALDVELAGGRIAALMPDRIPPRRSHAQPARASSPARRRQDVMRTPCGSCVSGHSKSPVSGSFQRTWTR
jgi:hypothetical protein